MATRLKWAAQLDNVHEVSIVGSADLGYWQRRLSGEGVAPAVCGGRASLMVVSAAGKFMGVRFRELSVSVIIEPVETITYFLVRAYNSNRFFAFCERSIFSTPYDSANVGVVDSIPTAISVAHRGRTSFRVAMRPTDTPATRIPSQEFDEALVARVVLPSTARSKNGSPKMFFARICGGTKVYPFMAGEDTVSVRSQSNGDVFDDLTQSAFIPEKWLVRSNASHAKSKTYSLHEDVALDDFMVGNPSYAMERANGPT